MEVNCWTWMWSCMAQHHSTLNRAGAPAPISPSPPPSLQQSTVCCCQHLSLECSDMAWGGGQELKCIHGKTWKEQLSNPLSGPACIRITHSLHFAVNWDEMKGERHPWQLWTREPWLTSGQGRTVLCADASQPSHRILIKPFPALLLQHELTLSHKTEKCYLQTWESARQTLKTGSVVKKTDQKKLFLLFSHIFACLAC